MSSVEISKEAIEELKKFKLPENMGFGQTFAPVMCLADYDNGSWGPLKMIPYQNISLAPTAKVFHYAQEIFEGLKAYYSDGKGPYLFRPEENMERFIRSGNRMAMPEVPREYFMDSIVEMVAHCAPFIPQGEGESLYLRPFMMATEEALGIKPSTKFK